MGKINVEAEKNELILENEFGDKVIIPAKKRQWVQKQIEKGNHADLDNYISTLPIKSDFAEEGSVVPGDPTKKVKVYTGKPEYFVQGVAPRNGERKNEDGSVSTHSMSYTSADDVHYAYPTLFQDGDKWIQLDDKDDWAAFKEAQKRKELFKFDNEEDAKKFAEGSWKTENIKEYDIDSPEYRELYNSGAIANYDKNSDTYILSKPLDEVVITAEAPQWAKDKRKYESQYTKDWYIDNKMPKFSRSMGVSATNMHSNNVKEYDDFINNKIVEDIFKRKPTFETDYSKDRLKTLQGFSQKELELIKNSKYAYRIEPSIWSKFEQGLLSVGNAGSPVTFKNENLTQEEAKKEDNPLNILQPLNIPSKMVQSAYKKDYSLKDALKGKQNNAGIVEDIVTDPLNLVGAGLVGKLSKADKVIDATKVGGKVLSKADDAVNNINRIKFDDFKNDNEFFRVIVGDEAFDDIVQTQKIRTKKPSSVENTPPNTINLDRRGSTAFPSFSKGSPSLSYANDNPNHYIIRTADESIKPSTSGRHGKGTTMFPTDKSGKHLTELDASKVQVYKHVGNGEYELVNTAKPIVSSVDDVVKNLPKVENLDKVSEKVITENVVKAGFPNPLTLLTKPKTLIDNILGRNQLEKNTSNLYRKIGNKKGLKSLIENEGAISPGYDNVWFAKGSPNEDYNGVFAVELPSDKIGIGKNEISKGNGLRTGYKITNKNNIPIEDLKVYRRRFLSTAYKEIDKTKLANELKTANIQNYIEKLWKYGSQGYLLHEFLAHEFPKDFDKWTPKIEKFYKEKIKPASNSLDEYMWNLITKSK